MRRVRGNRRECCRSHRRAEERNDLAGEIDPVLKLAPFVTRVIVGRGAEMVRVTVMVVDPVAVPVPAITMLPV